MSEISHLYDDTKAYDNTGPRGLSSIEVTAMNVDTHLKVGFTDLRMHIMIAPTLEQVKELLLEHPDWFESVPAQPFENGNA